jgi:uncharacterized repeat protein (TIGR02543 family)
VLTLTMSPSSGGTVSKSPDQTSYHLGDTVQLTATPAANYTFTGWSGDMTGSVNPVTITINGDMTVMAIFDNEP